MSYSITQFSTLAKAYTTTAREPSIYARGFKNGVLLASAKITAIGRNQQNADTIHVHIFQQVGITTHPEWILTFKLIFLMYCACYFIKFILTIRYGLKGQSISTPNHS